MTVSAKASAFEGKRVAALRMAGVARCRVCALPGARDKGAFRGYVLHQGGRVPGQRVVSCYETGSPFASLAMSLRDLGGCGCAGSPSVCFVGDVPSGTS